MTTATPHRPVRFALLLLLALCALPFQAQAADTAELEPNNSADTATVIPAIGLGETVSGAISPADDTDYFRFSAVGGRAYVIELFNVAGSLGIEGDFNCTNVSGVGLGILVYNSSGTTLVLNQCIAYNNGSGNVHNSVVFRPSSSGSYYVRLQHNSSTATGGYNLRILPGFENPGAAWSPSSFEPNNRAPNAYLLPVGRTAALTSSFEAIDENYASDTPDTDWYRFGVIAGREYSVEVYDVASDLSNSSSNWCDRFGRTNRGLWLTIYRNDESELLRQCELSGAGDVHTMASFQATETGIYYASVRPHGVTGSGVYRIRVLPRHDQAGASWDSATFEPNNAAINAYALTAGRANALTSAIGARSVENATSAADVDWYRFTAQQGVEYTVETFSVAAALASGTGTGCDRSGRTTRGLTIIVYSTPDIELGRTCSADDAGGVHSALTFTAPSDGTYYVRLLPNDDTSSGSYSLRVVTPDDQIKLYLPLLRR